MNPPPNCCREWEERRIMRGPEAPSKVRAEDRLCLVEGVQGDEGAIIIRVFAVLILI